MLKKLLVALALLAVGPASAQWQVPNNTIPIGRGAGVTGFASAANTGTGTLCLLNTTPPAFGVCPGGSGTYTIPYTGGVAQTQSAYNVQRISVKDFGAKGDGTTDDSIAIQAAVTALIAGGGVELDFPQSTACYKTTSQILIDLSAITTRYQGRIQFHGNGVGPSCISNLTLASAAVKYLGNASALETGFQLDNMRITGGLVSGSIGLQIQKGAFALLNNSAIEGMDLGFDATDVDQFESHATQIRFNNMGMRFNAAGSVTSANSLNFFNSTIGNNNIWGLQVTNCNTITYVGGSIQYNGTIAGGSTQFGVKTIDCGNGYGAQLFDGMIFEGNGGAGDYVSSQSAGAFKANVVFNNVAWARTNNGGGVGYGTNNIAISGAGTNANYKIINSNFYGYGSYAASAARPAIANTNTNALVEIDGLTTFWSATEAPASSSIYTGYAGSRDGSFKFGQAAGGLSTLSAPASASSFAWTLPGASDTIVGRATTDTLTSKTISGASNTLTNIGNSSLTNPATTVNGQTCTLGSTCTISASAGSITAGTTTVTGGPGVLSNASSGGVLVSSTTLPSGLTAPSFTVTGAFTATGLVTNADLANSSLTVNGTAISLGASGTVTAAASTLTGTTLNSTVVTSSLTSVGTLTGGSTGAGFTIALGTSTISGLLIGTNGGTGVNNGANTITLSGNLIEAGAFQRTITATATSNSTLPAGTDTLGGLGTAQSWLAANTYSVTRTIASGASIVLDDWNIAATTTTITGSTNITTAKGFNKASIYAPTYTDASSVTITNAATLYLEGPPIAAGSVTITNPYVLRTGAGNVQFNTGGTNPVLFSQASNYNAISLNNTAGIPGTQLGLFGGAVGDPNTLYVAAPAVINFVTGAGTIAQVLSTGLNPLTTNVSTLGLAANAWLAMYSAAYISTGTKPVGTTGTCTASAFAGGATAGTFSAAVCTATNTFILSSMPTAPTGYSCDATDRTTSTARLRQTATSATSATFTVDVATIASDVVAYKCTGW